MSKKTLIALAVSAALMPGIIAQAADSTTAASSSSQKATSSEPSSVSSASSSSYVAKPRRGHGQRGVAFGNSAGIPDATSHASSVIAQLPMSASSSKITLFGELDGGVTVRKLKGKDTTVRMTNGNWYWTSWGIKGIEALDNDNQIIFTLQQAFKMNSGQLDDDSKGGFNNQAFVGAQGRWGRLTFGHQAGLSSGDGDYSMLGGSALTTGFDPIGSLSGIFITSGWLDNSIAYRTQQFAGFQFTAMYSNGIDEDTDKFSKNAHYYGLGLTYNYGAFSSNFMWEMIQKNKQANATIKKPTQLFTLGASYDFGPFTLYGTYQHAEHTPDMPNYTKILVRGANATSGSSVTATTSASGVSSASFGGASQGARQDALSLSIAVPAGGGTWMLQANGVMGKIKDNGHKYNAWSLGTAYTYPLSKRTLLYSFAGYGQTGKALKKNYSGSGGPNGDFPNSELSGFVATAGMATTF